MASYIVTMLKLDIFIIKVCVEKLEWSVKVGIRRLPSAATWLRAASQGRIKDDGQTGGGALL